MGVAKSTHSVLPGTAQKRGSSEVSLNHVSGEDIQHRLDDYLEMQNVLESSVAEYVLLGVFSLP